MSSTPPGVFLSLFLCVPCASGELDLVSQGGHTAGGQESGLLGVCSSFLLCNTLLGKAVRLPLPPVLFIQNGNGGACFGRVRLD